ncbi:MAG: M48 family metallopeptidase [Deltaproteobacteria bacterium]|nr:M48 family metallopeptidase [Deltaproteobacteria bacterium]
MKLRLAALFLLVCLSACSPKLRFAPGTMPNAETPPAELKTAAEGYVAAHIDDQNYREVKSGPAVLRVKRSVERLTRGAGYPPGTFPVHLVDAGVEVNAAAFNGASIVVYEELLRRVPSDDDLATVIGHEVGHILAKHYTDEAEEKQRASAVSVGSSILGSAASIAASAAGYSGASDLAGSVTESATGAIGYGAFVGSFNRTQEYEADHLGLLIMARAGYNPENALRFWSRADEIFGSSTSSVGSFFSTHPASSNRLKSLEEAMPFALAEYKARESVKEPADTESGKKQKSKNRSKSK